MFTNVGNKLKVVAKIYFWVMVVLSVVCACVFGIDYGHSFYHAHSSVNALLPIILIIGPACAYMMSLLIYGFGELINNTSDCVDDKAFTNPFKKKQKEETSSNSETTETKADNKESE